MLYKKKKILSHSFKSVIFPELIAQKLQEFNSAHKSNLI